MISIGNMNSVVLKPVPQMMQSSLVELAVGGHEPLVHDARDRRGHELDVRAFQGGQVVELNSTRLQPNV